MRGLITCLLILACFFSFASLTVEAALPTKQISPAEITKTAQNYLEKTIPLADVNLQLKSKLVSQQVPPGKINLKVKPLNNQKWGGHTVVPVQILVNGNHHRTVMVTYNVQVFEKVVVTVQPLKKGDLISHNNVTLKRMDISQLSKSPRTDLEAALGTRAVRYLNANTILTKNDLEEMPLVLKGKPVTIKAKVGLIEISALAKALQDGKMGNLVQVQNLNSGKKLYAKVVGPALVEVPNKK